MMTVAAAGVAYVWTTGMQKGVQEGTSAQAQSLQEAASSCMSIDSVAGRNVYLRNCGTGTIDSKSLLIYFDGIPANGTLSPQALKQGEVGTLALSGLWNLAYGKHALKITNGNAEITQNVIAEVQKDGLVGYWGFDEGSGTTAYDGSMNKKDGAISGAVYADGKYGKALSFSGSGYVRTPPMDLSGSEITLLAWFKGTTPRSVVRHQASEWIILVWDGNSHRLSNDDASFLSNGVLNDGNWHQTALSWKQNTAGGYKSYKDGVVNAQRDSVNTPLPSLNSNVYIGSHNGVSEFTTGIIDDVKIYNKALTPDDTINLRAA